MTIFLVLGLFAGFYMLWLIFNLATYALPFYVGLGFCLWFHGNGHGFLPSIALGFLAGVATLTAGGILFQATGSPLIRGGIAALFAIPAGFAGYQAVHSVVGLAIANGVILSAISGIGALAIAGTAWRRITAMPQALMPASTTLAAGPR